MMRVMDQFKFYFFSFFNLLFQEGIDLIKFPGAFSDFFLKQCIVLLNRVGIPLSANCCCNVMGDKAQQFEIFSRVFSQLTVGLNAYNAGNLSVYHQRGTKPGVRTFQHSLGSRHIQFACLSQFQDPWRVDKLRLACT